MTMKITKRYVRYGLLGLLLLLVWMVRLFPAVGEWYALHVYPFVSGVLSSFSSLFPFSLGDLFIFLSVAGVLVYPLWAWYNKRSWKRTLCKVGEYLLWVYVWFYMAWGLNYFREDFYARASVAPVAYTPETFRVFLDKYVKDLNASYTPITRKDENEVATVIREGYKQIDSRYGLAAPRGWQRVKTMLFTPFISKVGVTGYMGPFFSEFNLNGDLLPSQYPATYAHEMAHLLGITGEAEANLYAYLVCTASDNPEIRFSGHFSLFPHVLRNASNLLSADEQQQFVDTVRPEVIQLYKDNHAYWAEKYSPAIGDVQDVVYDWYLKGNKIESGRKNYSEVIALVMAITTSSQE